MEENENSKLIFYKCAGANCRKKKGTLLAHYLKKYKLHNKVKVEEMDCNDRCAMAPVIHLHPQDIWFSEKDLGKIFKKYLFKKHD